MPASHPTLLILVTLDDEDLGIIDEHSDKAMVFLNVQLSF